MGPTTQQTDPVVEALDEVEAAVEENMSDERLLLRRVRSLRTAHRSGKSWTELLRREQEPGALALVGRVLARMSQASGVVRRALASSLRAEGETIPAIARRFGVTHQRISSLLRESNHSNHP